MNRKFTLFVLMCLLVAFANAQTTRRTTATRTAAAPAAIPAGTEVQVRIIEDLSSETAKAGDTFHGTLTEPIVVNGKTIYPKGADVTGTVVRAKKSGRLSDPGELELSLDTVQYGSQRSKLKVESFTIKGASHTKSNVGKIGGGAAAGAIIGAIAGGGKGAAIGAGVGAAAGTGVAAATGKKNATVESEAVLPFRVAAASTGVNTSSGASSRDYDERYRSGGREGRNYDAEEDDDDLSREQFASSFSDREKKKIRSCFRDNREGLPPGLAKRESLPPGLQKQMDRTGKLPPGLQKKVQPLPEVCSVGLPRLPVDWRRVVLNRRVLLLDPAQRILDSFSVEND